jgi:hypothetical protein
MSACRSFGGDSHLQGGPIRSEGWTGFDTLPSDAGAGTPHAGSALDANWFEHGWHSDIPGPSETGFPRIKTMLYLTKTTKDHGAIRFIAGSREFPPAKHRDLLGAHLRFTLTSACVRLGR